MIHEVGQTLESSNNVISQSKHGIIDPFLVVGVFALVLIFKCQLVAGDFLIGELR